MYSPSPYPLALCPSQEVPMIPRPHYAQPGCVYFICLLRDDLLLRQGAYIGADPTCQSRPFWIVGGVGCLHNSHCFHMTISSNKIKVCISFQSLGLPALLLHRIKLMWWEQGLIKLIIRLGRTCRMLKYGRPPSGHSHSLELIITIRLLVECVVLDFSFFLDRPGARPMDA